MKKSALVTLVLSTALAGGCDDRSQYGVPDETAGPPVTNNTYVVGRGYYHAPYHGWFEYPYNYYRPGFGYYHGGLYTPRPYTSPVLVSRPSISSMVGASRGAAGESHGGVARGGFGSIGRGGFGGA
jgi:hypothetical protein